MLNPPPQGWHKTNNTMTIEAIKYVFDKMATKPDVDFVRISLRGEPRDIKIDRVNGTFQYIINEPFRFIQIFPSDVHFVTTIINASDINFIEVHNK
jgi:hypothetical protein